MEGRLPRSKGVGREGDLTAMTTKCLVVHTSTYSVLIKGYTIFEKCGKSLPQGGEERGEDPLASRDR